MSATTSKTSRSDSASRGRKHGTNHRFRNGKRQALVNVATLFDDQSSSVWKNRRRNIATSQALADEIVLAIDVDAACGVRPADEGDPTLCQGQTQPPGTVSIAVPT